MASLAVACALAACGGGGGNSEQVAMQAAAAASPATDRPESATPPNAGLPSTQPALAADTEPVRVPVPLCTAEIDAALLNGVSTGLSDSAAIARCAHLLATERAKSQALLATAIYTGVSTEYRPGQQGQLVIPHQIEATQPLVQGDAGHTLASISQISGGRSAAYGVNVLAQFASDDNLAHAPAFKRLLGWLVQGNPDTPLPATLRVGFAGLQEAPGIDGLRKAGIAASGQACDFVAQPRCIANIQLLVVAAGLTPSATLSSSLRSVVQAGTPVLYVNTLNWTTNAAGEQLLTGMGLSSGDYYGNYWRNDAVAGDRGTSANTAAITKPINGVALLLERMSKNSWRTDFDWSACTDRRSCNKVAGLKAELLDPAAQVAAGIDSFSRSGIDLFSAPDATLLKLVTLWADVTRRSIKFPMDKARQPQAFQAATVADAWVRYVRATGAAQADLGTFMEGKASRLPVSTADETITVTLPSTEGFTAIGRFAVPGKTLNLELLEVLAAPGSSGGAPVLSLRLNTQRPGSTPAWGTDSYDRPRFLASPTMALQAGRPLQVNTPYGGTLQLHYSGAAAGAVVRLRVRGVARHPYLDMTASATQSDADQAAFVATLDTTEFGWAEIKMSGLEIHTRVDLMQRAMRNGGYRGDMSRYLRELRTYLLEDAYQLAGFVVAGRSLPTPVQAFCTTKGWDCTHATVHGAPSVQHINADYHAACSDFCSGNPLDLTTGVDPRGWGESHELGHGLQKGRLNVYNEQEGGNRSLEVSNNVFPLHKNWRLFNTLGIDIEPTSVGYRTAFDQLNAARAEADPVKAAYRSMWQSNAYAFMSDERAVFYMHWVHYWAYRTNDKARAWELLTLLYLHARLFEQNDAWAAKKDKLGYGTYATRPDVNGNDDLLITLSWLTGRDQRATFDLWGVTYSPKAATQVASLPAEPAFFYASRAVNNHADVRRIDMSPGATPVWPF